ncbi:hypothetical protein ABIB40_001257 [Pedobacter sp. UYP30]|uniref:hypothetical protein n=1 Tax=Pedobacter sp. UYP30 TaxID=1756400 RepID=UPI0033946351
MDLLQEWNEMNIELVEKNQLFSTDVKSVQKSSKTVYLSLLKNLNAKMTWIRILSIPMLLGAFFTTGLLQYLLLGTFVSYELGRMFMIQQVNKLPNYIDYLMVTKDMIAFQLKIINRILKMEKIWAYIFGPFFGPLGYMASSAFKYKTLDQILVVQPNLAYILLGLALLVFPICYLGNMMNKYAFAKDVERLFANLKELEDNR